MSQYSTVDGLRQAFPNLNPTTIQDVLNAKGGDVPAATDMLLMISGPQTQQRPPPTPPRNPSPSYTNPSPAPSPSSMPSPYVANGIAPQQYATYQSPHTNYLHPSSTPIIPNQGSYNQTYPQPQQYLPASTQSHVMNNGQQYPSPAHSPHLSPRPSSGYFPQQQNTSAHTLAGPPTSSQFSTVPDISRLSISSPDQHVTQPLKQRTEHAASCDGCGANPIRGIRWHCLKCPDEDLCGNCKDAGVQNSHRFIPLEVGVEQHDHVLCDGCKIPNQSAICGTRYVCQTHADEDFCETCVREGRACNGPFKEIKASPLAKYIEQWGCTPMPQEWVPLLQPQTCEYNYSEVEMPASWREYPPMAGLCRGHRRDWVNGTPPPSDYKIDISKDKHHFSWKLHHQPTKKTAYKFKADVTSHGTLKNGILTPYHGQTIPLLYKSTRHGNSLSLTYSGHKYRWSSNMPVSNLNGNRSDFARWALFQNDSRGEKIIADYTDWDGYAPDPAATLTLRTRDVDEALIIATYFAVTSYDCHNLDREILENPAAVNETEAIARLTPLGRNMFYYRSDHVTPADAAAATSGKMSGKEKLKIVNNGMKMVSGGLKIANAILVAQGGQ